MSGGNAKNGGILDKIATATKKTSRGKLVALSFAGLFVVSALFILAHDPAKKLLVLRAGPQSVFDEKKRLCEDGLNEGKFSFWLNHMRDEHIVCTMFAETLAEMKGEVGHGVPKIIHQSWKTTEISDTFKIWASSWKTTNPDYQYWFWTDKDNRELVEAYYPEFLYTYDVMPANINRADFARGLYMHKYGGVYADLDTWCLRPVDTLFTPGASNAYVAEMSPDTSFTQNLPNAWFASAPGHPFWIFFSKCVVELMRNLIENHTSAQIEQIAGPLLVKQAVDAWNSIQGGDPTLEIVKAGKVYVNDWHAETDQGVNPAYHEKNVLLWEACNKEELYKKEIQERCKETFQDAVVLTFWSHTWGRK